MRNQLDKAIRRVMAARHAEHRRAAVLVILALLTILSVSWRLHQVGIAMTDDEYSCGYEEHVHSDACYTEVLICGYEDGASETPADSAEEDGETAPAAHSHTADLLPKGTYLYPPGAYPHAGMSGGHNRRC